MEQDKDTSSEGRQSEERESVYSYGESGIEERHGRVPPWLWAVAVALLAWGIYYLMAYWSPPT
ncbi:MAG TPA: hypothetical protein VFP33_05945 [Gallionella sp.]|nr:hypothetical protein [Gallionella sp.]